MRIFYSTSKRKQRESAFTLIEVIIAAVFLFLTVIALGAALSYGFTMLRVGRENLRATEIIVQKMEVLRLCTWSEVNGGTYLTSPFTEYYNPLGTNNHTEGARYTGFVAISSASGSLPSSTGPYSANDMRLITLTLYWTNSGVTREREMQTYVSRIGLQDYIP